jgi:hypothetical protein
MQGRLRTLRATDVAEAAGLTLVAVGAGLAWLPAGLIVGGLAVVVLSIAHEFAGRRRA